MLYVVQEIFLGVFGGLVHFIWMHQKPLQFQTNKNVLRIGKLISQVKHNIRRKQTRLVVASHPVKTNQTEMKLDLGKPSNSNDKQIVWQLKVKRNPQLITNKPTCSPNNQKKPNLYKRVLHLMQYNENPNNLEERSPKIMRDSLGWCPCFCSPFEVCSWLVLGWTSFRLGRLSQNVYTNFSIPVFPPFLQHCPLSNFYCLLRDLAFFLFFLFLVSFLPYLLQCFQVMSNGNFL